MARLDGTDLTVEADGVTLIQSASFHLCAGELVALLGPNGAGKTTLLRAALGLARPKVGAAVLDGADVYTLSPRERARRISYLPQTRMLAWPNTVRDVVALGRFAHGVSLGRLNPRDQEAVDRALSDCDLLTLAHRRMDTLSGGESGRVHCARAFAAEAPLLVADEPVAALDPRHQYRIMTLIRHFVDRGAGALVVLHDVPLAARFADRLIWMKEGRIVADGLPQDTLTTERMESVYGVTTKIEHDAGLIRVWIEGPA